MGHSNETNIQIQVVKGGFILTTYIDGECVTEVFASHSKLIKALRALVETKGDEAEAE